MNKRKVNMKENIMQEIEKMRNIYYGEIEMLSLLFWGRESEEQIDK